jgi:hypothetical protein
MAQNRKAESALFRRPVWFILQAAGLTAALCAITLFAAERFGSPAMVRGVWYGCLLSLFLMTSGYAAIQWAFHRPAKTFYAVVMGGMLVRFVIIGLSLVVVRRMENVHLYGFVGAVMASYVLLQVLEIRFIQTELRPKQINKGKTLPPDASGGVSANI